MIPFSYLAFVRLSSTGAILDRWLFADAGGQGATEYALVGYAPTVASRRRSRLGGSGDWADVSDELTVHVLGSTVPQCVANYDRLIQALDRASSWAEEETTDVIQVRAQVQNGTVGELASVVLGPEVGAPPAAPDPEFDETVPGGVWIIRNVTVRFRRRGLWLAPTPDTATSTTTTVGEVMTTAVATHPVLSPLRVSTEGVDASDNAIGYLLTASRAVQLQIINASTGPNDGSTSVADAAGNYARGGNVLRFTAASAATVMNGGFLALTLPNDCAIAHVFCNARPGSSAAQWELQINHSDNGGFVSDATAVSVGVRIPVPQNTGVNLLYLGTIARAERWDTIRLNAYVTASSFPQTLDVNTIVLLAEDDTTAITFSSGPLVNVSNTLSTFTIEPRALEDVAPRMTTRNLVDNTINKPLFGFGERYPQQRGAAVVTLHYLRKVSASAIWRVTNIGGSAPATMRTLVRRWKGYRVPQ